jgi:hypothetical protein
LHFPLCIPYFELRKISASIIFNMGIINRLVEEALKTGYLTLEAEEQLRKLVQTTKYSQDDFDAFVSLQLAAQEGLIRQESREAWNQNQSS